MVYLTLYNISAIYLALKFEDRNDQTLLLVLIVTYRRLSVSSVTSKVHWNSRTSSTFPSRPPVHFQSRDLPLNQSHHCRLQTNSSCYLSTNHFVCINTVSYNTSGIGHAQKKTALLPKNIFKILFYLCSGSFTQRWCVGFRKSQDRPMVFFCFTVLEEVWTLRVLSS